jgi:hypothetical protein
MRRETESKDKENWKTGLIFCMANIQFKKIKKINWC